MHRLLRRWLPSHIHRDVVEPALADLQFEAERSHTPRERREIVVRGYLAIARAIVASLEPARVASPAVALSALCAMGMLLLSAARAAHVDGRVLNSAILAPAMLAPFVLRMLGNRSGSVLFCGSLLVSVLTPVIGGDVRRAILVLIVFAPIAAGAAIVAAPSVGDTRTRRAVTAVSLGSATATTALLLSRWPQSATLSSALAMTPFYLTLFAVLFAVTVMPLLLLAGRFTARPAPLAIAGLACSPMPLIAGAYLDHGTLTACFDALRHAPLSFAASSLPFAVGALAVGWRLPAVASSAQHGSQ
jgi:hypothetical protein